MCHPARPLLALLALGLLAAPAWADIAPPTPHLAQATGGPMVTLYGVSAAIFLLAGLKGLMDLVRKPKPGADSKPLAVVTLARWLALAVCLTNLVVIILVVFTNGRDGALAPLFGAAAALTTLGLLVVLLHLQQKQIGKPFVRVIFGVLVLLGLLTIPADLMALGGAR